MVKLKPSDVQLAARELEGVVNRTPVHTSRTLNDLTGNSMFFKCENFQRVGAFKFRGAYNAISKLGSSQREAGVICHSSGNHAQGVALAGQILGVKAVVVMPDDAPRVKRTATEGYGAEVILCQAIERESVTDRLIRSSGYTLIHSYDNDDIILGQGTAAWELLEEVPDLDYLFVPVGGGGLISGTSLAVAALEPSCQVVGVEPELAADAQRSWRTGKVHILDDVPNTVADGLRLRNIGQRNLDIMTKYVADMTTVGEAEIAATLLFLWQRMKIIVEPSAAAAFAPIFTGNYSLSDKRVGVILSGGNIDLLNLPDDLLSLFRQIPLSE